MIRFIGIQQAKLWIEETSEEYQEQKPYLLQLVWNNFWSKAKKDKSSVLVKDTLWMNLGEIRPLELARGKFLFINTTYR